MALADVLFKIQSAVAKVEKDGSNPHTKSRYPTLEAVLDVLNPALHENGVIVSQITFFVDGQWVLKTSIVHGTEGFSFDLPLLGLQDSKNQMQAIGGAITYARRYALMAYFKLAPTDDDGETAGLTVVQEKKQTAQSKGKTQPKNYAPSAKDMKIPNGKYRGQMLSSIDKDELAGYVEQNLQAMEESGVKPPPWFNELRRISGL